MVCSIFHLKILSYESYLQRHERIQTGEFRGHSQCKATLDSCLKLFFFIYKVNSISLTFCK